MANDVARALGYKDPKIAIQRHVKSSQKTSDVLSPVNGKRIWAINESGFYRLVLRSKSASSKSAQKRGLMLFENEVFGSIGAIEVDGEIWFVANDVALALGYKDPAMAIQHHVKSSQKTGDVLSPVRGNKTWAINEVGFYRLVLRSKSASSKSAQKRGLMLFENEVFGSIGAIEVDGEIWFVANDVALALGYKDPAMAIQHHVKSSQKTGNVLVPVRGNKIWAINESGFYRLVLRSKLEGAEKIQDWVTEDILPTLRKTGSYSMKPLSATDAIRATLDAIDRHDAELLRLEREKASKDALNDLDAYARGRYPGFSTVHDYVKSTSEILN